MLIKDIQRVKEILPVNVSFEFQKLKPFVFDAERIVIDTIGEEFYKELDAHFNAEPFTADKPKDDIIKLLQEPITYLAFYICFNILNKVFSTQGFHRIENEESGKKSLFQRQEENLRNTFKLQGYNRLDICLDFLEKNKTDYPTWTDSEAYTLMKRNFINSTEEFSTIYNINKSRLMFLKLRNHQTIAEDFDVLPLIGRPFFDELKEQVVDDNLTPENEKFLQILKKAVAFNTIKRGGVELLAELNEYGLFQTQLQDNAANFKTKTAAEEDLYNRIIGRANAYAVTYLKSCESFLKENIDNYPTYANSSAYNDGKSAFDIEGTDKVVVI